MTDERKKAILAVKHIMKPLPEGNQRTNLENAVRMLREDADIDNDLLETGAQISNLYQFHMDVDKETEFEQGWNSAILEVLKILKGEENAETDNV